MLKPMIALYVGGMGAREMNFHFDVFCRLGYEAEAHKIQDLYLAGHQDEAVATVPRRWSRRSASSARRRRSATTSKPGSSRVTTMLIGGPPDMLRLAAELVLG